MKTLSLGLSLACWKIMATITRPPKNGGMKKVRRYATMKKLFERKNNEDNEESNEQRQADFETSQENFADVLADGYFESLNNI